MRTTIISGIAALTLASGCISLSDSTSRVEGGSGGDGESGFDRDECKIEGAQIGREGTLLRLGAKTVTFHDWVAKRDSPGELVGFSITIAGASSVGYVVKASGELYASRETTWLHPAGPDGGSQAPGISNVDFCEGCADGSCDDGGGGGGGGGDDCFEPNGCDGGGGGGGDGGDGGGDPSADPGIDPSIDTTDPIRDPNGDGGGGDCFEPNGCAGGGDGPIFL